jgi:hypothetical protein
MISFLTHGIRLLNRLFHSRIKLTKAFFGLLPVRI